jgi:catechol 2,3-dioxygenase-like lactoylglutathione lyase family enzyme
MDRQFIDHTGISVEDLARSKTFYADALAPLGITLVMEVPADVTGSVDVAGFGAEGRPFFFLAGGGKQTYTHIAFGADTRAQVDAFYKAAIAAGGKDNGPPGIRAHYHPNYYGAFVLDPDGHNIEAVCHKPEEAR